MRRRLRRFCFLYYFAISFIASSKKARRKNSTICRKFRWKMIRKYGDKSVIHHVVPAYGDDMVKPLRRDKDATLFNQPETQNDSILCRI